MRNRIEIEKPFSPLYLDTYDELKADSTQVGGGNGLVEGGLDEAVIERGHGLPGELAEEHDQEDVAGRDGDTGDQRHPRRVYSLFLVEVFVERIRDTVTLQDFVISAASLRLTMGPGLLRMHSLVFGMYCNADCLPDGQTYQAKLFIWTLDSGDGLTPPVQLAIGLWKT